MKIIIVNPTDVFRSRVATMNVSGIEFQIVDSQILEQEPCMPFVGDCAICREDQFALTRERFAGPVLVLSKSDSDDDWLTHLDRLLPPQGHDRNVDRLGMKIDYRHLLVTINHHSLDLTLTEFKILTELASDAENLIPRTHIEFKIFGKPERNRTLDVHICSLRKKVKPHNLDIECVRGFGYRIRLSEKVHEIERQTESCA